MRILLVPLVALALAVGCKPPEKKQEKIPSHATAPTMPSGEAPQLGKAPDDMGSPHVGAHGVISRSLIATMPMEAPILVVDGTTFTRADLERTIAQHAVVAGIPPDNIDNQVRDAFEQPAYEKLIERHLLGSEAKRRGLWPKDDELAKEKEKIGATLPQGKTLPDLYKLMGTDEKSFLADVASDLAIAKLFEALEKETPKPSDADLKKIYDEHKSKFVVPDTASASHILVRVPRDAPKDDDKKALEKAKALRAEVKGKGKETFAKVASEKSDDPSAKINAGDLGMFARGEMLKEFEDAAFKLKDGDVSEPVRTDYGWHVIRGQGSTKGGQKTFDEVKTIIADREGVKTFMDRVDGMVDSLRAAAKIQRLQEPLKSPFDRDDTKGTRVPAWRPTKSNVKPNVKNPHAPVHVPPGAQPG